MGWLLGRKMKLVTADEALPGRDRRVYRVPDRHAVLGTPLEPPFPEGMETAVFALGCFWGAERLYWTLPGVYSTSVGYTGGHTPNPTYEETCSGLTGHTEAVLVVYDPATISYAELLRVFFEEHDPTQGMRQGNDIGTQYRSGVYYTTDAEREVAEKAFETFQGDLKKAGYGEITSELKPLDVFYFAEEYHQQYLHKVPNGYCGLQGTGVPCAIPASANA
jgi:peptide-methionine (S)-S-oxide reductase